MPLIIVIILLIVFWEKLEPVILGIIYAIMVVVAGILRLIGII